MSKPAIIPERDQSPLTVLQDRIERVFVGKENVVQDALACLLAGGHLLIEDVPGVGKTTLALSLAKATGCTFQRIQFTSDMMPSDILGVSVLNPKTQEFEFRKGPVFSQVVLADELNRATPRTQSALLESMNERQVTIDNQTMPLPNPFFVVATQNPHEHHGTFPLPESQLDRFMMRLSIGYPDKASEKAILAMGMEHEAVRQMETLLTAVELLKWMDQARQVLVAPVVDDYLLSLVQATRTAERVEVGVSPRGAIALRKAAQARALLQNRDHVTPDDIKALAIPVLAHRLIFSSDQLADLRGQSEQIVTGLLRKVPVPL
jgi:MoxR-like ATPase